MFKKCKKTVCSTNSVTIGPNRKPPVAVRCYTNKEFSCKPVLSCPNSTNALLKNGGSLPFVLMDPTAVSTNQESTHSGPSSQRKPAQKKITYSQKTTVGSKRASNLSQRKENGTKDVSLQVSINDHEKIQNCNEFIIDKENYLNIIAHFNEYDQKGTYDPSEYTETKQKQKKTPPSSSKRCQIAENTKVTNVHEKTKLDILHSIREELKSWNRAE